MAADRVPLRYAFDLGTNSIGWAVYRLDRHPDEAGAATITELLGCGVRLFDDGRNPKDGKSLAEMRRVPRSARKRRDRFIMRRTTLLNQLVRLGLLPEDRKERLALSSLDPYRLRALALDQKLTPFEIGRALLHINQRRGFLSNRRADRKAKDDENRKIASGIARAKAACQAAGARTFGEFLWRRHGGPDGTLTPRQRDPKDHSVRIRLDGEGAHALYEMYPSRQMLTDEFDAICAAQAPHHPAILTDEAVAELRETIFHQRPMKPPPVGKCTFVPEETRLPKALPSVEERVIYETLNSLRYGSGVKPTEKLNHEQRDLLADKLRRGDNVTFVQLRKLLGIGKDVRISLEEGGKRDLEDYAARSAKLAYGKGRGSKRQALLGERWFALPLTHRDEIVRCLIDTDDETEVIRWMTTDYGLTDEQAQAIADWRPADGHARLGPTANAAILKELMAPDLPTYSEATLRAGWHHSDERDGVIELPLPYYGKILERHVIGGTGDREHNPEKRYGRFPNPTAHVALNQLRRVVNQLVATYGAPAQVIVELARELKLNKEQKDKEGKRNKENRDIKDRHRAILAEHKQIEDGANFLRLRLFEEQERANGGVARCPFTLRTIKIADLFSSEVEIEHLLPYSRTLDDSAANKVVCYRDANRRKRTKTPHEAFSGEPNWPDIEAAARGLPANKRWRFAADAMKRYESTERDFLTRQLNETRHLSRMARIYLSKTCDPDHVYVATGQLTAMLRARWGLNTIFRDHNRNPDGEPTATGKARDDHRHHAVDACVIGAIDRRILQAAARAAGEAETELRSRVTDKVEEPFAGFREAVRAAVEKVIVSVKPEHGKGGALHEDTAYGPIANKAEAKEIGNVVYRKLVTELTPGEINRIRDPKLRRELQELVAPLRDAKGKVPKANEKEYKALLAGFTAKRGSGREHGVRRVRIGKSEKFVIPVKNRQTGAVYKALAPGENHHIDIVQMRDGTWRGFAATFFDVNQKGWRPRWEVEKLGGKLVMRLHKGDMIEVDDKKDSTIRRLMTVHQLKAEKPQLFLAEHHEGGALQDRHEKKKDEYRTDPFRWDMASISSLRSRRARKVRVDEIGRVLPVRSNLTRM